MRETVTVTRIDGNTSDGDPAPRGPSVDLPVLEIAPGNASIKYGEGGDLTDVQFTVYLPLRDEYVVRTGDEIVVRGKTCVAAVQVWKSQQDPRRGGVVVLCRSASGKAA